MRFKSLQELRPLLEKLPEAKRRAILEAFRDAGQSAARINEQLDREEARRPTGAPAKARGSKYGNKLVEDGGELFHSVGEWQRWRDLQTLQRAGVVSELERQVEYPCAVAGVYVCSYFADFRYKENGKVVVEDFKGYRTDIYKLKKKIVEAIYKVKIFESGRKLKRTAPHQKAKTYTARRRRVVKS